MEVLGPTQALENLYQTRRRYLSEEDPHRIPRNNKYKSRGITCSPFTDICPQRTDNYLRHL
jgi:hypothetical protein